MVCALHVIKGKTATTYKYINNKLEELKQCIYISQHKTDSGIDFHFIVPQSSYFGGLFGMAMKSAKNFLLKGISSALLTYEKIKTIIIEVEVILNPRPIKRQTFLLSNPKQFNKFIIGDTLIFQL